MLTEKEKNILDKIFYNDNGYIFGLNKFNELVNESGYYIPQEKIRFYYKNQEITQLFKPRQRIINKINESNRPYNKMYADTLFITYANVTILNILDYYSRYNYVFIFKISKQLKSSNAAKSLLSVINDANERGYKINKIVCDNGSEFLGKFKDLCNENNIIIEYSNPGDKTKVAPIESFNRTMRLMLERYKIINNVNATNIYKVIKNLNDIYNNSYHTIIKAKPIDILNSTIEKHINKIPKIEKYNIGDHVRIYEKDDMDPFNKLSPLWSKKIYEIEKYNNNNGYYKLYGVNGLFKYNDLQKIDINNLMIYNKK